MRAQRSVSDSISRNVMICSMSRLELQFSAFESVHAPNFSHAEIDILHVGVDHVDVTQNPLQRR
jgi:hypothetical protein